MSYEPNLEEGFVDDPGEDSETVRVWRKIDDVGNGFWIKQNRWRTEEKYKEMEKFKMPINCPICKIAMLLDADKENFYKYGCCYYCTTFFVEGRVERWKSGWRPKEDDMVRYDEWVKPKLHARLDQKTRKR